MLDDLLKQIGEAIEGEDSNQEKSDPRVNIVVGNDSTVVIGDGNRDIGRRKSDQPGGGENTRCYGRRASDQAIRDELQQLRRQVKDLVQLITRLFLNEGSPNFKDDLSSEDGRLNSCGRDTQDDPGVSFCSRLCSRLLATSKTRATPRPVPNYPIQSRFIPDVSYLMTSHSQKYR